MVEKLKVLLLESKYPFFTNDELTMFLEENENDVYKTASELCYLKADSDERVTVGPITIEGAGANFWIKLAQKYSYKSSEILRKESGESLSGYKNRMRRL